MPHIRCGYRTGRTRSRLRSSISEEEVDARDNKYLWGNSAYAFATCLTNAFAKYFWCAAIRGVEGGGLVEGLPVFTVR